jgi:hypothetical protein
LFSSNKKCRKEGQTRKKKNARFKVPGRKNKRRGTDAWKAAFLSSIVTVSVVIGHHRLGQDRHFRGVSLYPPFFFSNLCKHPKPVSDHHERNLKMLSDILV